MKRTIYILAVLVLIGITCSCGGEKENERGFDLRGVWELSEMTDMYGDTFLYPQNGMTWMRIYDDSCYYMCQMETAPTGTMITPSTMQDYDFIRKGTGDILYLQGGNTYPLTVVDDSTMVIQQLGRKYTWRLCKDFDEGRRLDVIGIIRSDIENNAEETNRYVFSKAENELKTVQHGLIFTIIGMVGIFALFINHFRHIYKEKKRIEQELRHIEQEHQAMPEPVRQALNDVEQEFHQSDFYLSLRKRIAQGERLKKEDWDEIDVRIRSVYPRFTSTLVSLHNMSETEYRVCLLIKLNVAPSEIATVLCKETSSISTVRSRLYGKVFGRKGSSKDWDEFILSL